MNCNELMNKIIDDEYMNKTDFSKEFDQTCASGDKLKVINMLVEHFQCDFEEAHHVCEYFIDHIPLPSDLTPQEQERVNYEAAESMRKVTCPYCGSVNVKKVSTISRMASVSFFGLGSKKVGKQWHCNNCKSDF